MAMYNSYFGFSEAPFENKLDQRFLFLGHDHREVLSALLYFTQERKGLGMVCGDVGTGKTMLLNTFLSKLPASVQPILIANPLVTYQELLAYLANTLGVIPRDGTLLGLVDQVKEALIAAHGQGKTFILIVDEAHLLGDDSLEQIRLLSNIEIPESKLLQILLVGQYELSHRLNRPELRQLRQRINVNRFLSPLSPTETWEYVEHRLQIVGSRFDLCFETGCRTLIHKLTGGVPRTINHLCDTALLICMGEGAKQVSRKTLKQAQAALKTDQIFTAQYTPAWKKLSRGKLGRVLRPALAGVFLLALGGILISSGLLGRMGQTMHKIGPEAAQSSLAPAPPAGPGPMIAPSAPSRPAPAAVAPLAKVEPPPAGPAPKVSLPPVPAAAPAPAEKLEKPSPPLTAPPPAAGGKKLTVPVAEPSPVAKEAPPAPADKPLPTLPNPVPEKKASPALTVPASRPLQVEVKENDTLGQIALRWFPGQAELGLVALLLANPQTLNQDKIFPGQKLNLPVLDPSGRIIQLKEGLYYALYGQSTTPQSLPKAIYQLSRRSIRYMIVNTETSKGGALSRVVIGAYETREDLEKALLRVKEGSG